MRSQMERMKRIPRIWKNTAVEKEDLEPQRGKAATETEAKEEAKGTTDYTDYTDL